MSKYIDIVKYWEARNIKTAQELSDYMQNTYVGMLHESNNIDSEVTDTSVARELIIFGTVTKYTGSLLVLTELSNASMCHQLLCKRFEERAPLDIKLVKEVHATLMAGCYDRRRFIELEERPGEFKKHSFIVGKDEVGVEPEDVEEELEYLLEEMNEFSDGELTGEKLLMAAAYFHATFECIHPFADGNGRTGRILLNYWLLCNNHPPVTIYYEDRKSYFEALQVFVDTEDLVPLRDFLRDEIIKTWSTLNV